MKKFVLGSCLLVLVCMPEALAAQASPSSAPPAAPSAGQAYSILGTWKLEAAKSDFGGGATLRAMDYKVTSATPEMIEFSVTATYESGSQGTWGFKGPADGKFYKLTGSESAYSYTEENGALVETQKDPDGTITKGTWTVSKNGKEGTWTYAITNPDGSQDHQKLVFAKAA